MSNEYEFHEAANIFPMDEEHIAELAADIKKNGQQVPVELLDGKIIDGRRRYKACEIAGKKALTRHVSVADPVTYVLSLNLHRRHLSETQRGLAGARAIEFYAAQAKERQKDHGGTAPGKGKTLVENLPEVNDAGTARDQVGKAMGVSGRTISSGVKVLASGTPSLIAAVEADKIAVSTAAKVALMTPEQQNEFVERAKGKPTARKNAVEEEPDDGPTERKGVGVVRANEAINCLSRIPKNDALRKRGFQIVTDWIKAHK